MSKFFVGQQVRLRYVREIEFSGLVGRQCLVTGLGPYAPGMHNGYRFTRGGDYEVRIDGFDRPGIFLADQLEPLIPPHEASQYSYTELMDRLKAGEVECV